MTPDQLLASLGEDDLMYDHPVSQSGVPFDPVLYVRWDAISPCLPASQGDERLTHGRHCPCSACAREDWTNPDLAPCGMHGQSCPREYAPRAAASQGDERHRPAE